MERRVKRCYTKNHLPWDFEDEQGGEGGQAVANGSRGKKTTETHLRDHIRGETFVQGPSI